MYNAKLLQKVKAQATAERPKIAGYPNLSRADLETVLWCIESGNTLNYATHITEQLYNDILKDGA